MKVQRREFITLLGGAAVSPAVLHPIAARAQQQAMPVIGYLYSGSRTGNTGLPGFSKGLREAGFVAGLNLAIEYRFADGHNNRLPELVADLMRSRPALIFAGDNAAVVAAKAASSTIPIVFWIGGDPIKLGLVASLSRPIGNVTGISGLATEVVAKRLQLLHDIVPRVAVVGALINPGNPQAESDTKELQEAARVLGLQLHIIHASSERDLLRAFDTMAEQKAGALLIEGDPTYTSQMNWLVALTARHKLPTIYSMGDEVVEAGGLMNYSVDVANQYREAALYVVRILKGESPSNLPVQQATKMRFMINRKTADTLGIVIPPHLYILADEVIE